MDEEFRYHSFLQKVVDEDVRFILEREKLYKGSWCKSGRSAYYMLQRKMDRLQEMMKTPVPPPDFDSEKLSSEIPHISKSHLDYLLEARIAQDIFGKVKQQEKISGGKGLDSSVIAEVRDLRRYLCLVESYLAAEELFPEYIDTNSQPCLDLKDDESNHSFYEG